MTGGEASRSWSSWTRRSVVGAAAAGLALLALMATRVAGQEIAPAYSVLYTLPGGEEGALPIAGLIADAAGNLYGTTWVGGNLSSSCASGCGLVFKLDPLGNETVLYAFTGEADGAKPSAGVIRDSAGNLYGTTRYGGNTSGSCGEFGGCGVVFKLDPLGNETVLYTFPGGAGGLGPGSGLIADAAGNLFGTTGSGGISCRSSSFGCGVVFKLDPLGNETVLYSFTGLEDGGAPAAGLIRDGTGNLYGTTVYGGNHSSTCPLSSFGCGVVFKLDSTGQHYQVLYHFTGGADGMGPLGGLVVDSTGNLYGTTANGGNTSSPCPRSSGCGVAFRLDKAGNETVLYAFKGGADGWDPMAGLIRDSGGNLYGTTTLGGNTGSSFPNGCGVVFKLNPSGNGMVHYALTCGPDGAQPVAGLLQYQGSLYGTTEFGGSNSVWCQFGAGTGCGVVFKITLP